MKSLSFSLGLLLLVNGEIALADGCHSIEYEALKNWSSPDLIGIYCRYQRMIEIRQEYLDKSRAIESTDPPSSPVKKLTDEPSPILKRCLDTQIAIRAALANRGESKEPTCQRQ
jgi:hypothetical protein